MSDDNKQLIRKVIDEIFNLKRRELITTAYAPNCKGTSPDGPFENTTEFTAYLDRYMAAFPDFMIDIQLMIAEGDWVALSYMFLGTNTGELNGLAPTRSLLTVLGFIVSRIKYGRIVEQHFMWDNLEVRRQLQLWQTLGPRYSADAKTERD